MTLTSSPTISISPLLMSAVSWLASTSQLGSGMGVTHRSKKTYPRTDIILGFMTPEQGQIVAEKIMFV
jgi:hypothetical protein